MDEAHVFACRPFQGKVLQAADRALGGRALAGPLVVRGYGHNLWRRVELEVKDPDHVRPDRVDRPNAATLCLFATLDSSPAPTAASDVLLVNLEAGLAD